MSPATAPTHDGQDHNRAASESLMDGTRIGRFVVITDVDGRVHAVAAGSISAFCETEDGDTLLMLPGNRMVRVGARFETVLGWLDGRGPG